MEDYPSIPLYRGEDIGVLKRVVDPRLSIVLPQALWSDGSFRELPDGAKLLLGVIISKLASENVAIEPDKATGIIFPVYRIKKLLGCSQRSACAYLKDLRDSGLVSKEIVYGIRGKGMHTKLHLTYENATVAQRNTTVNLAPYITIPPLEEAEQIPFSAEEQKAIWDSYADGDTFAPYILLMIYTGMMPGELMKARKDMVDWNEQIIVGGGIMTDKRKVTPIMLADTIVPVLEKICEYSETEKLINLTKKKFYAEYYACLERAGTRKLRPYSCRHTTGTALGTSDIPLAIAKEIMRHTKITTTQKYIHVDTATMLAAANKLGKIG